MTKAEFIEGIAQFYEEGLEIIRKKNQDYAGDNGGPFQNFYAAEHLNIVDAKRALLVRMTDKMQRVANLLDKPPAVADEAIEDTLLDLSNYSAILMQLIKDERTEN